MENNTFCSTCKKGIYRKPFYFKKKRNFYCSKDCEIKGKSGKPSWNKDVRGEEYMKHFKDGKTWHVGLTKETHPSLLIISQKQSNKNNPNWKGDDVGYGGVHGWIRDNKPKPNLCENCKEIEPYDLANISGEYKRDINDFKWLCRKCHMLEDGRMNNLKRTATYNFGSKNGQAKLKEEDVIEIKTLLLNKLLLQCDIAKKFNIGRGTIGDISRGKTWNHIKINQNEKEVNNGV